MSFRTKILLGLILVGVGPLELMGWLSFQTSSRELRTTVGRLQRQNAEELARFCAKVVEDHVGRLRLTVSTIPFAQLSPAEMADVLSIPYSLLVAANIVVLLDAVGNSVVPPRYRSVDDPPTADLHEPLTASDLAAFSGNVPLAAALEHGVAVGPPYRSSAAGSPRVAVAVRLDGTPLRVIATEFSLREIEERMHQVGSEDVLASVLDGAGAPFVHSRGEATLSDSERTFVGGVLGRAEASVAEVSDPHGDSWLAALAAVPRLGWGVMVSQRSSVAFRAAQRVRLFTMLWAGLALALTIVVGSILARGLSKPVAALSEAAAALSQGSYDRRVDIGASDEIGRFGQAFNHMAEEIQRRDSEIRTWNEQLHTRVEQRTAELRAAQQQILRTQRLSALGSMGAGLAHELNNPMTGVMGLLSLLRSDLPPASSELETVDMVLVEARRITKIVSDFRRFADQERESAGAAVPPVRVAKAALEQCSARLRRRSVAVCLHYGEKLPHAHGDEPQLQQVLEHLIDNAAEAMSEGGRVTIGLSGIAEEAVKLTVTDTGPGIPNDILERIFDPFFTTKAGRSHAGMGLSVVHSIVGGHDGQVTVQSTPGTGTTFTVVLPAAPKDAHLY